RECTCTDGEIRRYNRKISGPLLDRIDLHISVQRPKYSELTSAIKAESSKEVAIRVQKAREIQKERLKKWGMQCNSQMRHKQLRETCTLDKEGSEMLRYVFEQMQLSARSYDHIIKVARTIADLDESENIDSSHIAEAISYRRRMAGR
ncbi:MAG: ATP-binding protein, partial [Dialister micraerophilus]|nr:ATP-binding protein [Dialister micraerophilus]